MRDAVVAGLATVAGAVLATALPFVGLPLAAAALGWLALRNGPGVASIAALLGTAFAVPILGWPAAFFVGPALLAVGPGTAWALKRWSVVRVITGLTIVLVVAAIAYDVIASAASGTTFLAARSAEAKAMQSIVVQSGAQSGTDKRTVSDLADQVSQMWLMLWPVLYLYVSGLSAVLCVPLVSRLGRGLGEPVSATPQLAELDLSIHAVWPTIAGLALLALAAFQHQSAGTAQAVGLNLLLAVRPVLFFQGLGDFAALYRKAGVGRVARGFGFVFLAFSESLVPSVSVVGLVDLFANLRKLPRGGIGSKTGASPA